MTPRQRIVALTVACALFMQTLDSSVLGTALPAIGRDFDLDPVRLHLAMTSYLIALAIFMPMSGWIADRYGTRNVLRVAIVVFVGASVGCGYSTSILELVLMRIVQGLGGAMMVPVARLALLRAVPKSSLVQAMTWVSVPALLGPVVGPPLGGFLVTYASWPWIFWINVPIGLIGILLATIFFENLRAPDIAKFDRIGFVLSATAVGGILFGLELAPRSGTATLPGYGLLAIGIISALLYARHARRHQAPIIDLSLLKISTFRVSIFAGSLFRIGIGAIPFLLPLMLQQAYGRSALSSGLITFSAAAGAIAMKFVAPRALATAGFRKTLTWNAAIAGVSIAIVAAFSDTTPAFVMLLVLFVGGFFRSLQFTALNAIGFADLDDAQMSRATGFSAMVQQLSLSIGVSIGALILQVLPYLRSEQTAAESDYSIAFLCVGALVATSALAFARLEADAGQAVSGHAATVGGVNRPPSDPRT
ncbi:EmrB/QacA subfamily drug resistance transporter [Breoghania corrubedonensis]|uniref:EmrB/QacA subfamily drug resistance transporter n=1 Tax=Breoghania corrubedonensis TaxID=665038 RepID=A0A2T5V9T8_9HYPH|nr:MFS transporter [Breoghania corrubedonensis]PTW60523.1 EmrB/QacA subfamily drug resistance transporter [Breoghania corrubedonensis]